MPDMTHADNDTALSTLAAVVLAAGQSRRLTQPKQLLTKHGQTLLHRTVAMADAVGCDPIVTVINPTLTLASVSSYPPATVLLPNPHPKLGLSQSLHLACAHLGGYGSIPDRVLIMVVDQVRLTDTHLYALLAQQHQTKRPVVASAYTDRLGVPLLIDTASLLAWQPKLDGDQGLRGLLTQLPEAQLATVPNPTLAFDIDTPTQLQHARAKRWVD